MVVTKFNEVLPKATAKRLPQYYRIFKQFVADKVDRTNSQAIAAKLGVDSATVRRDFSLFGELGRRGYGYDTTALRDFFGNLLGDSAETNIALVGVGNLGRALINYRFHDRNKMRITKPTMSRATRSLERKLMTVSQFTISQIFKKILQMLILKLLSSLSNQIVLRKLLTF